MKYTADDFTQAEFARHEDGRIAARLDTDDSLAWRASDGHWRSDADMAAKGWQIVTPAPTTARECLDLLEKIVGDDPSLVIDTKQQPPDGTEYMIQWGNGTWSGPHMSEPDGVIYVGAVNRRYLLDPREPEPEPEWHSARIVEARVIGSGHCQWASTSGGMWVSLDGSNFSVHRDNLTDVTVIVPGEVEA